MHILKVVIAMGLGAEYLGMSGDAAGFLKASGAITAIVIIVIALVRFKVLLLVTVEANETALRTRWGTPVRKRNGELKWCCPGRTKVRQRWILRSRPPKEGTRWILKWRPPKVQSGRMWIIRGMHDAIIRGHGDRYTDVQTDGDDLKSNFHGRNVVFRSVIGWRIIRDPESVRLASYAVNDVNRKDQDNSPLAKAINTLVANVLDMIIQNGLVDEYPESGLPVIKVEDVHKAIFTMEIEEEGEMVKKTGTFEELMRLKHGVQLTTLPVYQLSWQGAQVKKDGLVRQAEAYDKIADAIRGTNVTIPNAV